MTQPSLVPSSSSSDSSTNNNESSTPPQEWLLEYIMPSKRKENVKEWSMQKVIICVAITIIYLATITCIFLDVPPLFHQTRPPAAVSCEAASANDCAAAPSLSPAVVHRGKYIDGNVKASELAKAYQAMKSEYASLALHPTSNTNWQVLSSHNDGSTVSLLEHPTDPSCPYVRMVSTMPGTIQQVWDFLDLDNWEVSMPKMDPFYEGLSVMGEYSYKGIQMKLARKTIKRLITFGKRDFTFVSVSDHPRGDGAWVSGTVSVVTDQIPRKKGYVRAYQDSIAFYDALDNDRHDRPQMKLTIVFRIDLNDSRDDGDGGYVPMWAYVKTVGTTGMASVQNMKGQLKLMAKERESISKNDNNAKCDDNWLARIRNRTEKC